jgi:hypothetical protein
MRAVVRFTPSRVCRLLFLFPAMTGHSAFASRLARFLACPLVRRPFLVRCLASLARDVALLVPIHRRKTSILFGH